MSAATVTVHISPVPDFFVFSGIEVIAVFFTMESLACKYLSSSFLYFFNTQPQKDNCCIKFLVVWLWSMDAVHQGLDASELYKMIRESTTARTDHIRLEYIIQILFKFTVGNLPNVSHLFLTIALLVSQVLVAASAQGFFAYRIWMFSNKSRSIIAFLAPAILFQIIDAIIFMVIK
ncbi:hypothetical protein IW262DRAFT_1455765 [Armillaria fumosa]|nr:hypothetical protein IW262DRAFT_1455765 [Armillaria fumosa]